MVCAGPIKYKGQAQLEADLDNLKAALGSVQAAEAFVPAIAPSNVETTTPNEYYPTAEAYVFAIAEAMREEYKAIVDAGFLLQIDDPFLVTYYITRPDLSIAECRKWAELRVEALNAALAGIPAGPGPLPHLLQHQHGSARARHAAQGHHRHHSEGARRRLFVRSRQSAPRARMGGMEAREDCRTTRC